MSALQQIVATFLSLALVAAPGGHDVAVGIVTRAEDAYIGETDASEGTTVYDGDHLSTEEDGAMAISMPSARLLLAAHTKVRVNLLEDAKGARAELNSGSLGFSAAATTKMEVSADHANIRTAADGPTIAYVTVITPRELRVIAKRGALEISYGGQSGVIPQGSAYRVILDPDDGNNSKDAAVKKPVAQHRAFLLIAIGAAAAAAAWGIYHAMSNSAPTAKEIESPDHP